MKFDSKRLKAFSRDTVLIIIFTFILYLGCELLFSKVFLSRLPLKYKWLVDDGISILAQNSKKSIIPHNYIAITGDSYATGAGDWYKITDRKQGFSFNSSHVIHHRTGIDVVSYGHNGAGSLWGMLEGPILKFEYINASLLYKLQKPKLILVYFFEGNDLNNNLRDLKKHAEFGPGINVNYDPALFHEKIGNVVIKKSKLYRQAHPFHLTNNLFLEKFFVSAFKSRKQNLEDHERDGIKEGVENEVLINGEAVKIPYGLQSPSLELTNDEVALGAYVFEQSLDYLKSYFKDVPIEVVYIPSPLTCYQIASPRVSIQTYQDGKNEYDSILVRERSDYIMSIIKQISIKTGSFFLDTRPDIWEASNREFLHGPNDWKHFNERGYKVLGDSIIHSLDKVGFKG